MKILALILFCCCLCAHAQLAMLSQQYAAPMTYSLTNEPNNGSNVLAWWRAVDYVTNGSTASIPNRCAARNWALTNSGAASTWPIGSGASILFNGGQHLQSDAYTSAIPHEVILVLTDLVASNAPATAIFFDSVSATYRHVAFHTTGGQYTISHGTSVTGGSAITNKLFILDGIFAKTDSQIYTNGVLAAGGDGGLLSDSGMTVGARYNHVNWETMYFYELVSYSATNSPNARSNILFFFTNSINRGGCGYVF